MKDLVKNWVASYSANFAGSLFLAWLSFHAKTMAPPAMHAAAVGIATMKVSLPWTVAFSKAILCNWLVCLGVWGAMSSQSTGGKLLAIWLPIRYERAYALVSGREERVSAQRKRQRH